jgi:hypothetical protein
VADELCTLACRLEEELSQDHWPLIPVREKILAKELILIPAEAMYLELRFVWKKSPVQTDFADAVASHVVLVHALLLPQPPNLR